MSECGSSSYMSDTDTVVSDGGTVNGNMSDTMSDTTSTSSRVAGIYCCSSRKYYRLPRHLIWLIKQHVKCKVQAVLWAAMWAVEIAFLVILKDLPTFFLSYD